MLVGVKYRDPRFGVAGVSLFGIFISVILKRMNKYTQIFLDHVKNQCKEYGVKCDLRETTHVIISKGMKVSGYFDETVPILVCSMNTNIAYEVLVHEFAHFTQWIDQCYEWVTLGNSVSEVDDWLKGKNVRNIEECIAKTRDLELDNEKRAVKLIKQFNLPIDIRKYKKKANAYIMYYNYLLQSRKWCIPGNTPYSNKRLIESMPDKFNMNYSKLPKRIEKIFIEEGI